MRRCYLALLLICCLLLPGCATMFTDKTQKVSFKTEPSGAKVVAGFANNRKTCITPCTIEMNRRADQMIVTISKRGYNDETIPMMPKMEPWVWANVANFGVGAIVDLMNDRILKFDSEQFITLTRGSESYGGTNSPASIMQNLLHQNNTSVELKARPVEKKSADFRSDSNTSQSMIVRSNGAKLRKTPNKNAGILKTLKRGVVVTCIQQRGEWAMIELPGGEVGWCHKSLLSQN